MPVGANAMCCCQSSYQTLFKKATGGVHLCTMPPSAAKADLPDLPPDDVGPTRRVRSSAIGSVEPKDKRLRSVVPKAVALSGPEPNSPQGWAQVPATLLGDWPELPADVGDLPEDVVGELALDGPLEGPAGRPARVISPKRRITFPGLSMNEIMQTLEMVPRRHAPLWSVEVPRNLVGHLQDDLMEAHSPARMVPCARKVGLRAELSIDLLTGWNLLDLDVRMQVVRETKLRRPKVLMMSPPCTWFSGLMNLNWAKQSPPIREQGFRDATLHLEFCILLADLQEWEGRGWVLEHPDAARSWGNARVQERLCHGSYLARFDQCCFGLASKVTRTPMKKRTRFMTNIMPLWNHFHSKFCDRTHDHTVVSGSEGGERRSVWAQRCPQALYEMSADASCIYCHTSPAD
jgi:hypothetical protein